MRLRSECDCVAFAISCYVIIFYIAIMHIFSVILSLQRYEKFSVWAKKISVFGCRLSVFCSCHLTDYCLQITDYWLHKLHLSEVPCVRVSFFVPPHGTAFMWGYWDCTSSRCWASPSLNLWFSKSLNYETAFRFLLLARHIISCQFSVFCFLWLTPYVSLSLY